MKCPKCHYLGFETGDRCKNCGYDFSLLTLADGPASGPPDPDADLMLRPDAHSDVMSARAEVSGSAWGTAHDLDLNLDVPRPRPHAPSLRDVPLPAAVVGEPARSAQSNEPGLPLFARGLAHEDEPLVKLPAAPRPPVAVRRTPEIPRIKPAERVVRSHDEEPLRFTERPPVVRPVVVPQARRADAAAAPPEACEPRPRAVAAAIDVAVLMVIDLIVVYLTLRVAALTTADWRQLPLAPLLLFLALLKVAYFSAFAAFGGQTIGKMAAHIRVVTEEGDLLTPARAIQRTLAAMVSIVTFGAAFLPALIGARRALHDRLARTRVVGA